MKSLSSFLADLIGFKTISHSPNIHLIEYLQDYFEALGFSCRPIPHPTDPVRVNLLCQIGPDKPGGIMLSGHTDVVPTEGQEWLFDPFSLTEQQGRFYGRGTTDMKGFIAATCRALGQIPLDNLKRPISLLWTYDEEVGCQGSHIAAPLLKNYFSHLPEVALIGEPTDFQVLRMHAGHATVKIHVKGKGAHSSDPALGVHAIKAMHQIISGIFNLEEELSKEQTLHNYFKRPFVLMNVGEIHGGSAVNIIPDECTIQLGFRPLPTTSVNTIVERITKRAHDSCMVPDAVIKVNLLHCAPAMMTDENTKLGVILERYKNNSDEVAAGFATDAGNLYEHGIPCLIFGPGSIKIAHQANEWIAKTDLEQAEQKLKGIILDYCS